MDRRRSLGQLTKWSTISLGIVLFGFLVLLPLTSIFKFALQDGPGPFIDAVTSKDALNAFRNSLLIAFVTTLINLVVGTLLAFVITRYDFPGRSIFRSLIDMPIAIPTAVVGISLMMLYGPMGILGPLLQDNGIEVVMAMPGVLLAHVFVTSPFMVRSVSPVLEKIDRNVEEAALTLGAGKIKTFFFVTLPSIRSGLIAGSALTFTRSLGEFGATLFIAGGMITTGPLYIYYLSDSKFDFQGATSIAIILMVLPFSLLLILNTIVRKLEV
ncbi:MAG: ABC transporter permease [Candidatus Thermoplasmatota archaeon]|nr:ABC transporter permease [Candidatus Thermoplasmatota archaeon]